MLFYDVGVPDLHRRPVASVDRFLKGSEPGGWSIEPFARTAGGLGLILPPSLPARADRVIE